MALGYLDGPGSYRSSGSRKSILEKEGVTSGQLSRVHTVMTPVSLGWTMGSEKVELRRDGQ